jgi:NADH-quinone oxidoreductase subunit J
MNGIAPLFAAGESVNLASALLQSLEMALEQPHAGTILRALAILTLGAAGVYLMLPRGEPGGRRLVRCLGGALATVALVLLITTPISFLMDGLENSQATILWELNDQPPPTCYTFHFLAFVSFGSAIMMITSRNPVYSALWFAMVLLGNSGLFLIQKAEFLSAATIIVYAGAIVVTFLFVIMLAQPAGTASYDRHSREPLLVASTGLVLASVLVGTLHYAARFEGWGEGRAGSFRPAEDKIAVASKEFGREPRIGDKHVAGLGKTLFVDHVASVEVIGVLLLAAVVGAMLIAGHKVEEPGRREKSG